MDNAKQHLDSLSEIKSLMERSTKFISLSGLSGVIAGIMALAGAAAAYVRLENYDLPDFALPWHIHICRSSYLNLLRTGTCKLFEIYRDRN